MVPKVDYSLHQFVKYAIINQVRPASWMPRLATMSKMSHS